MADGQANETITVTENEVQYATVCVDQSRKDEVYYYEIHWNTGALKGTYGDYWDYDEAARDAEITLQQEAIA